MSTLDDSINQINTLIHEANDRNPSLSILAVENAINVVLENLENYRKLDREAASYVETVIAMRTNFTGDPPYVGWKGLGLALREALDERDKMKRELAETQRQLTDYKYLARHHQSKVHE